MPWQRTWAEEAVSTVLDLRRPRTRTGCSHGGPAWAETGMSKSLNIVKRMWDTRTGPASSVRLQKAAACFCCAFGAAVDFCSSYVNALPGSLERLNGVRGNVAAHDQTKQGYKTIEEEWPCHSDKNVASFASKLPSVNKTPTTWQNRDHATTLREQKQDRDPQKVHEKTTPEMNPS